MEASELRIGNYISHFSGQIFSVEGIIRNRILAGGIEADEMNWFPVLLTEEILIKFGFERTITELKPNIFTLKVKLIGSESSDIRLEGWKENIFLIANRYYASEGCKYLHELQNLFFAITGNELKKTPLK